MKFLIALLTFSITFTAIAQPVGIDQVEQYPITSQMIGIPSQRESLPAQKNMTIFASGHGFTKTTTDGVSSDDTVDYVLGSQSFKITTTGNGAAIIYRKTGFSSTDLSGKNLVTYVKFSDVSKLAQFWVVISSDTFTNFYTWKPTDDKNQFKSNVWQRVTLSFGGAVATGSPTRSAITAVQFRLTDDGTGPVTANLNGLGYFNEPSAGVVSIEFDDGYASTYNIARPEMDKYGFVGSVAWVPGFVGQTPTYMTLDQIQNIQNINNWDVLNHTWQHTNLTTLSLPELESDIRRSQRLMNSFGFSRGAYHLVLPQGGYDYNMMPYLKKYFKSVRTTSSYPETIPPGNRYVERCFLVLNTTTTTQIANAVTSAKNNKYWLRLVYHQLVPSNANASTQHLTSDFITEMADIDSQAIRVLGPIDVMESFS